MNRHRLWFLLVRGAALLAVLVLLLFPFAVMGIVSLRSQEAVYRGDLWGGSVRLSNYLAMWRSDTLLPRYFLNSLIVASGSMVVCIVCAVPAAFALARFRFRGRKLFLLLTLATQMFSPILVVLSLLKIIRALNLLDTYASLILANAAFSLAFSVWLLSGYFRSIPAELEEAALIDGCSPLGALVRVVLPVATPGLVTVILFSFINAWNEFLFALLFIATPARKPLTLGLYSYVGRYNIEWPYLMAASLVATLPVLLVFLLIERKLVHGLTAGALKG